MLPWHATLSVQWCDAASSLPACHVTRLRVETVGPLCPPAFSLETAHPWPTCLPLCLASELLKPRPASPKRLGLVGVHPGHATHWDGDRLCPKPCVGLPGCMQTFGFPILPCQGQGAETQRQFLGRRFHTVFCLIEGVDTCELGFSTSICRWLTQ